VQSRTPLGQANGELCSDAAHSCRKRPVIVHVWRNLSPAA
jgi:hypothetical protein